MTVASGWGRCVRTRCTKRGGVHTCGGRPEAGCCVNRTTDRGGCAGDVSCVQDHRTLETLHGFFPDVGIASKMIPQRILSQEGYKPKYQD